MIFLVKYSLENIVEKINSTTTILVMYSTKTIEHTQESFLEAIKKDDFFAELETILLSEDGKFVAQYMLYKDNLFVKYAN